MMYVRLRLWVCNQSVVSADSDETSAYLRAAGWRGDEYVEVQLLDVARWYDEVFLRLRREVAAAGWGVIGPDESPSLVAMLDVDMPYTTAMQSMMMQACVAGDGAEVDRLVHKARSEADYVLAYRQ